MSQTVFISSLKQCHNSQVLMLVDKLKQVNLNMPWYERHTFHSNIINLLVWFGRRRWL